MKCPNCDFIDKDEAFGDPAVCPKCGAIYEKALKIKADKDRQELFEKKRVKSARGNQDNGTSIKSRIASASASVSDGREKRAESAAAHKQKRELQMVVVTDIDMPFWSMVGFMIKLGIAALPAFFIIFMVYTFVLAVIGQM